MSFYRHDGDLQALLADSLSAAAEEADLRAGHDGVVAACLAVVPEGGEAVGGGVQAGRLFYPASLVKLFHFVAYAAAVEEGGLVPVEEDERALGAMLRNSGDDADRYLLGRLTGAGPDVWAEGAELTGWLERRRGLNRAFEEMGVPEFQGIMVANPTFAEGPYGAEMRFRQAHGANRLSPAAVTRLMLMIAGFVPPRPPRAGQALALMDRGAARRTGASEVSAQVRGFLCQDVAEDAAVWSKAGWTASARHDVLFLRPRSGTGAALTVMTSGESFARSESFLPAVGRRIAPALAG